MFSTLSLVLFIKTYITLQLLVPTSPLAFTTSLKATQSSSLINPTVISEKKNKELDNKKRVIIVGGGVGGLAVASRISSLFLNEESDKEIEIIILEKNKFVGGRCGSFSKNVSNLGAFRHERGPSLLLLKDVYESLFEDCGTTSLRHGLRMKQCIPAYQAVFDDGDSIELGFPCTNSSNTIDYDEVSELAGAYRKSREKMDRLENNGASKWDEYMRATSAFLDCGLPNFIEERLDLKSLPSFLTEALRDGAKFWPLKPHSDVLDAHFTSIKMKALASFQDLYVGLEPYRNNNDIAGGVLYKTAPAVFGLLSALELHPTNSKAGVFAPIGGFESVSDAFSSLAKEMNVEIEHEVAVTKVTDQGVYFINKTATANATDIATTAFLPSDLVIVNADIPYAFQSLVNKEITQPPSNEIYDWDDSFDFSSGVVSFHWSINKRLTSLNTHNVFLIANNTFDAQDSWRSLRQKQDDSNRMPIQEPFNFYVHRPSKEDSTAAPDGCDVLMILVPCFPLSRNISLSQVTKQEAIAAYQTLYNQQVINYVKSLILKRLSVLPDLEHLEHFIVDEIVDTPADYADLYNVGAGVPFGLSHGFSQLSVTRPGPQPISDLKNVLFVGASSRPGNGVPLVLIGAKNTAAKAIQILKN